MLPRLIVHGGAWNIPEDLFGAHLFGIKKAIREAFPTLAAGGSALDAVEIAVQFMEEEPCFDAGRGSFLNNVGEIEMDAMIMDGKTLDFGAVAAIQNFLHPVSIARKVMEDSEHCILAGEGAASFALEQGFLMSEPSELLTKRELEFYHQIKNDPNFRTHHSFVPSPMGTVGAVAMDRFGNIAAATSTGGTPRKLAGRVGDSPIIGSGTYAENEVGGISSTGWGESILRVMLAKRCCDAFVNFPAMEAAKRSIDFLAERVNGRAGLVGIASDGQYAYAHNTHKMAHAFIEENGEIHAFMESVNNL